MAESTSISERTSFMVKQSQLKEEDVNKQVSDVHIEKISYTCNIPWKRLCPYLEMERNLVFDLTKFTLTEGGRRYSFFLKWKESKGSAATYKKLISALLEIKCVDDAECICKLLQRGSQHSQQPQPQSPPSRMPHEIDSYGNSWGEGGRL